jgi:uncharacterized protein YktB (UPF0637 family)
MNTESAMPVTSTHAICGTMPFARNTSARRSKDTFDSTMLCDPSHTQGPIVEDKSGYQVVHFFDICVFEEPTFLWLTQSGKAN